MAGGLAFDPAEFAAFKARSRGGNAAPQDAPGGMAPAPSSPGGFDPAEFEAFKARRSAPSNTSADGEPGALRLRVAAKALDVLAGMVAFKVGGPGAGLATYGAKVGQRALVGGVGARDARRSFEGGAPRMQPPAPALPTGRLSIGGGLSVSEGY